MGHIWRAMSNLVTLRHIVLAASAILVIGLGVKLFYEVRASPTTDTPASLESSGESHESRGPKTETDLARDRMMGTVKDRGGIEPPPRKVGVMAPRERAIDEEVDSTEPASTRVDLSMTEANSAYDRGDFDDAKDMANRILAKQPDNVRMRRILVSAACMQGDPTEAQRQYDLLPTSGDARQVMQVRCKRAGITFVDKTK